MQAFTRRMVGGRPALCGAGNGAHPPVLLVHGAFSNPEQLGTLQRAFAQAGFATIALALRGHDRESGEPVQGLGLRDYVRDVVDVARALDDAPILVGHSMGGLVVAKAIEGGIGRAGVLIAAAPPGPVLLTAGSAPVYVTLLPRVLLGRTIEPPRDALRRLALNEVAPDKHDGILEGFVPESGVAFRDMVLGRIRVNRSAIRVPLLAVFGGRDVLVPPWQMRRAARRLGAQIQRYETSGHFLFEEPNASDVLEGIVSWCARSSR